MKVIYSIGSKFGGHGIGAQAVHAVRGIYRARALEKVLASYQDRDCLKRGYPSVRGNPSKGCGVPKKYIKTMGLIGLGLRRLAYYDPTGWGYILHDNVFDRWAATQLEPCDVFHGWNHHCSRSLLRAKELGATTVVERASSHILQGQEILKEEYQKYGVRGSFWPQAYVNKCLKEYDAADYILVPSEYARQSFLERGFDPAKVVKVSFGVEPLRGNPCQSLTGVTPVRDKFVVLYVGEIRLGKGVQYLLEAWEKMQLKDAELWLVGEVKRDIKKTVLSKYRNYEDIRWLGFRKDVPELMQPATVFAFPSLDEGSANVTYEAMAAGLPVITTPHAGSLVRDSLDGYLIPIRNSEALAERIEFFYHYPQEAVEMGKNGQERMREFTWETYGENLVKAYIKMLK